MPYDFDIRFYRETPADRKRRKAEAEAAARELLELRRRVDAKHRAKWDRIRADFAKARRRGAVDGTRTDATVAA
jgi:hypothetical protein